MGSEIRKNRKTQLFYLIIYILAIKTATAPENIRHENINKYYDINPNTIGTLHSSSKIYKAKRKSDGLKVIIKAPNMEYISEVCAINEFKIIKTLNHPNVIKAVDSVYIFSKYYLYNKDVYIVLEKCNGERLQEYIETKEEKGIDFSEVISILRSILLGLKHIHENDVTHGDLKTTDIVFHDGEIKILDFGEAQIAPNLPRRPIPFEERECHLQYAPEVLNGLPFTTAADMWSFGDIMDVLSSVKFNYDSPDSHLCYRVYYKNLKNECMRNNPELRITSERALQHPLFKILFPEFKFFAHFPDFEIDTDQGKFIKKDDALILIKEDIKIKIKEVTSSYRSYYEYYINGNKVDIFYLPNKQVKMFRYMVGFI